MSDESLIYCELVSVVGDDWQVFLIVFAVSLSYQSAQQEVAATAVQSADEAHTFPAASAETASMNEDRTAIVFIKNFYNYFIK